MKKTLILVLCLFASAIFAANKWEFVTREGEFKIYKQKVEGSSFIELKGAGVVYEPPAKILSIIFDYRRIKEWQPDLETFERLVTHSDKHFINYFAIDLPWPVSNRDVVTVHKVRVDNKKKWVHISVKNITHRKKPRRSGFLRVPLIRGHWSLHSIKNGKATYLEFRSLGDPGGLIPAWLVNWLGKKQIAGSIRRLKKRVREVKGNYNNAVVQEVMKWK